MGIDKQKIIQAIEAQIAVADEIGSDFITLTKGKGKAIISIIPLPILQAESVFSSWQQFQEQEKRNHEMLPVSLLPLVRKGSKSI